MNSLQGLNNPSFCPMEVNLSCNKINEETSNCQKECPPFDSNYNNNSAYEPNLEDVPNQTQGNDCENNYSVVNEQHTKTPNNQSVNKNQTVEVDSKVDIDKKQLTNSNSNDEGHKKVQMTVSINTYKKIMRQLSHNNSFKKRRLKEEKNISSKAPRNYNDLAIFTCFCCLSPFGLAALILSALSTISYNDGKQKLAERYSKMTQSLALAGILLNLLIIILVAFTKAFTLHSSL